ncbi:hypothetical protein [Mucilaginibacter gotjawali]|uniref:Uncharacterized protein n=2 Tax=Mucilaginibacter gotjawali TaxID=1550579 RepID=A0A0X8X3W6_9SPHI|nr:hypothetical protein [Mucilaginibacter gotjawali]MBB3057556.1 hypothetical protein [Mucilaginibacter gotjawali]BAU55214.1 hypothetical protein MgSA37_03395 [Mucilaginibacter gotjawali]
MENYPFDTTGLTSDTIDLFNDTYMALKAKFDIQVTGNIDFQLEQFEVFSQYDDVNIRGSYALKHENGNDCYVIFVEAHSSVMGKNQRFHYYQYQTWAVAYVKSDFDRVLIRRETLTDKIIELVHPVELDFEEDKAFSDTFYVLVNDRDKATRSIDRNFRNAVMDIREDGFVVEIMGHTLIAGSQDPVMPGMAVHLAEFAERVCKSCS